MLRGPRYADSAPTFPSSGPVLVFLCGPDPVQGSESALKPWRTRLSRYAGLRAVPDRGCAVSSSEEVAPTAAPSLLTEPPAPPRGFSSTRRRLSSGGIEPCISCQGGEGYPQQHERLVPSGGCQRCQEPIQRKHRENCGPNPPLRRPRSTPVRQVGEDDCSHDRDDVGHAGHSNDNDVVHSPIRRLARELSRAAKSR
jgi:hypothetical protein